MREIAGIKLKKLKGAVDDLSEKLSLTPSYCRRQVFAYVRVCVRVSVSVLCVCECVCAFCACICVYCAYVHATVWVCFTCASAAYP